MKRLATYILLSMLLGFSACVNVKPHEKVYLNDADMQLKAHEAAQLEMNAESYREGSSGGLGGKTGGGCGCN